MDRSEFDKLDRSEDRMWWFAAAHATLLLLYRRTLGSGAAARPVLDAGCGTGGLLTRLAAALPATAVFGLDADHGACARALAKSGRPVCTGSVNALPFADGAFGAIFNADVLCHRDVDERAALDQFRRCLADDGVLLLNLPAYRWMLSRHDRAVANVRRYNRGGLTRLLRDAGFRLLYAGYWNIVLFPAMVLTRKLLPGSEPASDVGLYPPALDALGRLATGFERLLLRAGLRFPFGGSLVAVAAKEPGNAR